MIGTSAGGLDALSQVLPVLRPDLPVPVMVVQHISPSSDSFLIEYLNSLARIEIREAGDKEELMPGIVYFAPPDYHLLVEEDFTLSLSNSEKVHFSRPSIDVLFETASWAYHERLIGVIMTGANWDGAAGLKIIKEAGGFTIAEDPNSAIVPRMPESAIKARKPDMILPLSKIGPTLNSLV